MKTATVYFPRHVRAEQCKVKWGGEEVARQRLSKVEHVVLDEMSSDQAEVHSVKESKADDWPQHEHWESDMAGCSSSHRTDGVLHCDAQVCRLLILVNTM